MSEMAPELQAGDKVRHRTAGVEGRVKAVTEKGWVYVQILCYGNDNFTVTMYSDAKEWIRCEAKS